MPTAAPRLFWYLTLFSLTSCLLYLSLASSPAGGSGLGWDKANHAVAMCVVTFVAWLSIRPSKFEILKAASYAVFLGILIELLQALFTTTRSAEWADLFADTVGIIIAAGIIKFYRNLANSRAKKQNVDTAPDINSAETAL